MDAQPPEPTPDGTGPGGKAGEVPEQRPPSDLVAPLTPLTPTGPPIRPVRRSRWRVVLAVALAIVPLLCVGGIPFAFHSYDTATRPDRSAPDVVVHSYLQAFLGDRNDTAAGQFTCPGIADLGRFQAFRAGIESGERAAGQAVSFSWVEGVVRPVGTDSASLDVQVVATVGGVSAGGSQSDDWSFTVDQRGQWCVAAATKLD